MRRRNIPRDAVKALKRAAREAYGFQKPRITANRKRYSRPRAKRAWRKDEG
jgi:hypothetical protein